MQLPVKNKASPLFKRFGFIDAIRLVAPHL